MTGITMDFWIAIGVLVIVVILSAIYLSRVQKDTDPSVHELQNRITELEKDVNFYVNHIQLLVKHFGYLSKENSEMSAELQANKKELIHANDMLLKYQREIMSGEMAVEDEE